MNNFDNLVYFLGHLLKMTEESQKKSKILGELVKILSSMERDHSRALKDAKQAREDQSEAIVLRTELRALAEELREEKESRLKAERENTRLKAALEQADQKEKILRSTKLGNSPRGALATLRAQVLQLQTRIKLLEEDVRFSKVANNQLRKARDQDVERIAHLQRRLDF